ncbi:hypothetical protein PPERSA_07867 [Pseudocohnilembus persalinus]|uniref:DUF676 domain-containing protein n=1 Tax=Pseudocohnilembus persalinus TaxID=266149 RepID=A0A0V0QC34_PSEPJ|nr:hypothetical protein PPERSA_07867 [Pseudocohnilembus persalinus]|eukprot:KRW99790.1 hypothetical protein PPERSA_07867 [Pseudocohnilembus persalinus]
MSAKKIPVLFTFNTLRNVYRQFQTQHFDQLKALFKQQNIDIEFLPIITFDKDTIEKRAKTIQQQINEAQEKLGSQKFHIVSYSASGLDVRYYLSNLDGDKSVESLTTIATPHKGSFLAEAFLDNKINQQQIEPISRLIGMSPYSFSELNTENIQQFNMETVSDTQVYSIGGERQSSHCSQALAVSGQFIQDNKQQIDSHTLYQDFIQYRQNKKKNLDLSKNVYENKLENEQDIQKGLPGDNDGVFAIDEIEWGTHLINFEADHGELVGIGNNVFQVSKLAGLVSDNLKHVYGNL